MAKVTAGEFVTVSVSGAAASVTGASQVAADTTAAKVKSPASMAATLLHV
jgi:hypothetical protein